MDIVDRAILAGDYLFGLRQLTLAAATGHVRLVKAMLGSDAVLKRWRASHIDECWMTPLVAAAAHGNVEMMQLLLDVPGIDAVMSDGHGWTPLGNACFFRNQDAVELLLRHGCDPVQQCGTMTVMKALQFAVDMADFELAKSLLGSFEQRFARDQDGKLREISKALLTVSEYGDLGRCLYGSSSRTLAKLAAVGVRRPTPGTGDDAVRCPELLSSPGVDVDYEI